MWSLVVLLGVVSLLTAIAGEAARGVSGPFLKSLGASAAQVGLVAGIGELAGYTLRLAAGFLADRPGGAWRMLLVGTAVGISAVPLLALAPEWRVAAALFIAERVGRALRTPARDVLLASASDRVGHGPGFGVHRLLDQAGAVTGPLLVAVLYSSVDGFRRAFVWAFMPSLAGYALAWWMSMRSEVTPAPAPEQSGTGMFSAPFRILCVIAGLLALGTADFALIAFHWSGRVAPVAIPALYAEAMAVEGAAAVLFGFALRRLDAYALIATICASIVAPMIMFRTNAAEPLAAALWSIGMGGQYALLRALVPRYVPVGRRGAAFGWFNTIFGVCWFAGSTAKGLLYSRNVTLVAVFCVVAQVAAIPFVVWLARTIWPQTPTTERRACFPS